MACINRVVRRQRQNGICGWTAHKTRLEDAMAVLVEAISVIVRGDTIEPRSPHGSEGFKKIVPGNTLSRTASWHALGS